MQKIGRMVNKELISNLEKDLDSGSDVDKSLDEFVAAMKYCSGHEWLQENLKMLTGYNPDGTLIYTNVQRCKNCFTVRSTPTIEG